MWRERFPRSERIFGDRQRRIWSCRHRLRPPGASSSANMRSDLLITWKIRLLVLLFSFNKWADGHRFLVIIMYKLIIVKAEGFRI
jgi:hypothetical protein